LDTAVLTKALRSLDSKSISWKFALYSAQKSRDGMELEWHLCNMQDISGQIELIREHLLKKPVADKPVAPYSPFLSDKENIGAMDKNNDLIQEQLSDIVMNIRNGQAHPPEDFISGAIPKIIGYAFYGEFSDGNDPIIFMRRSNPFISGNQLFAGSGNEVSLNKVPIFKLSSAVDFISISGVCYFLSAAIEKDFEFENRHFAIAQKWLDKMVDAEIIGNYDNFERTVMTAKNARKFLDFDEEVLEHIVGLSIINRDEVLGKYGASLDQQGRMDTYDSGDCELIIDLLCGRSCLDPLGRLSVGSNITPRE
jgi:hypothetical protein